ncbi:rRNA adenine N(6)-methyltransferase [Balamuthia mandrillaris]
MKLPAMPSPAELVRMYGLVSKKDLAQNFLLDLNITDRVVRSVPKVAGSTCIEVGPGPGGLTRSLLKAGARKVIAIEKDTRFRPALETLANVAQGRLELHFADALQVDEEELLRGEPKASSWEDESPVQIVGNLPFNVATELLLKWLRQIPSRKGPFAHGDSSSPFPFCTHLALLPVLTNFFCEKGRAPMTLLFQTEVGERIFALPGTPEYGRLSVMTGVNCTARYAYRIPGSAFVPPPKVSGTLVTVIPREKPVAEVDIAALEHVCREVMGLRRKVLTNALRKLGEGAAEAILGLSGLPAERRPQDLGLEEWCRLTEAYQRWQQQTAASDKNKTEDKTTQRRSSRDFSADLFL